MNTTGLTARSLVGQLDRAINELEYPPIHPTFTGEDILDLLKVSRDVLANEFNLAEDEDDFSEIRKKVESNIDDIELAVFEIKRELNIL